MSAKLLAITLLSFLLGSGYSQQILEVNITCTFEHASIYDFNNYACIIRELNFNFSNPFYYINIDGEHDNGMTNDDVRNLVFVDSDINQIPGNIFQVFRNIQAIGASDSGVITISPIGLQFAQSLEALFINNNRLTQLTGVPFFFRPTITHLNFYANQIETISDSFFLGLNNLIYLSLGGNSITSITPAMMAPLVSLRTLLASFNQIESLSSRLFSTNRELEMVAFEFNNINAIGPGIFDDLQSIEFIGLMANECVNFEFELDDETTIGDVNESLGACFNNSIPEPPRQRQLIFELRGNMTLNSDFGDEILSVVGRSWN